MSAGRSQEQMHIENEHRFTRLELMVAGLYFLAFGMAVAPRIVPIFLSVLGR